MFEVGFETQLHTSKKVIKIKKEELLSEYGNVILVVVDLTSQQTKMILQQRILEYLHESYAENKDARINPGMNCIHHLIDLIFESTM